MQRRARVTPYRRTTTPGRGLLRGGARRGRPFSASPLPTVQQEISREMPLTPSTLTPSPSPSPAPAATEQIEALTGLSEASSVSDLVVPLQRIFGLCQDTLTLIKKIDTRLSKVEDKTKELHDCLKKFCKNSFSAKGSVYEGPIKSAMAGLFCESLLRKPDDKEIQEAVKTILGNDARVKYKFDSIYAYAKNKLTDYRTEERRKVIGLGVFEKYFFFNTSTLCEHFTQSWQTEFDRPKYTRHLAILRKFVRESPVPPTNFYDCFREWLSKIYPAELTETEWKEIMEEDDNFDYTSFGSGMQYEIDDQEFGEDEMEQ